MTNILFVRISVMGRWRQMELHRPWLDWTLSVTSCLSHRYIFFYPSIFFYLQLPYPSSSFSMSAHEWLNITGELKSHDQKSEVGSQHCPGKLPDS